MFARHEISKVGHEMWTFDNCIESKNFGFKIEGKRCSAMPVAILTQETAQLLRWAPRALEGGPSERQHLLGVGREDSEWGRRTTKGVLPEVQAFALGSGDLPDLPGLRRLRSLLSRRNFRSMLVWRRVGDGYCCLGIAPRAQLLKKSAWLLHTNW